MSDKKSSSGKKEMIKNYEIIDVVGKGGMGEVYLAKHPTLKREIILKRLKIRDKEASERFLQEAKVMLDFRHENIVQFYDHFKENGSTYIAMEYVKGKALNKIIEENEIIPIPIALFILYQIATGLHHAHTKKVIHRDIKPHNILISREGEVKLTDFGISLRTTETDELTKTGTIVGTPTYMAPEQFSSKKQISYQTDIYALGVVFYEMITGVRPFKNEYSSDLIHAISKGKYPNPARYIKKIPGIVRHILRKTFNPKMSRRYKSLVPLIKKLRNYFKHYNIFEIRDSIKKLVLSDKKLLKSDFLVNFNRSHKIKFYRSLVLFILLVIAALSFAFYYTNSYYELLYPDIYGKFTLKFKKSNIDENNIFVGIDGKYEKAVLNKKFEFNKIYYLKEGEHEFSVVAGSYKNIKKYYINSISTLRANNSKDQVVMIPITDLRQKEVEVYFRFWDSLNPDILLFKFDPYPDEDIKKYLIEEGKLKIFNRNSYMSLKDYIYKMKSGNAKDIPFYSNKKYSFMVEDYELNGVHYDSKKFNISFSLDDRTVVVHVPLNQMPAVIKIESVDKNLPIFLNNSDSGLVYENGDYIYKDYQSVKFINDRGKYYATLNVPQGSYEIKIKKSGKSLVYKLTSGREITIKVTKQNGKYIY